MAEDFAETERDDGKPTILSQMWTGAYVGGHVEGEVGWSWREELNHKTRGK